MKTLVADDDSGVRGFLAAVLADAGYEVLQAQDGAEVLRLCAAEPVDLVLTDLCMPEKEGFETMRALRERGHALKVIAISGAFQSEFLPMARKLGADAVLPKPIDPEKLLETVGQVLGTRS